MTKVMTIEDAAKLVEDGDVVALQNMATQAAPMAMVRELIRQAEAQPRRSSASSAGCPSTGSRPPA